MKSDITSTIQLTYLLPILLQKRLVTEAEFQQLSSEGRESDSEKNGKLIRIITGKGEDAYDLFVEALQEEQEHLGHSSLAKISARTKSITSGAVFEAPSTRAITTHQNTPYNCSYNPIDKVSR